eukprot:Gb_28877 [translate_table: standard]
MDWQGHKLSELLMRIMLVASALVAFVTGYIISFFKNMLIIYAAEVIITLLTTVPNWPFFNRHPLQWVDPKEGRFRALDIRKQNLKVKTLIRSQPKLPRSRRNARWQSGQGVNPITGNVVTT